MISSGSSEGFAQHGRREWHRRPPSQGDVGTAMRHLGARAPRSSQLARSFAGGSPGVAEMNPE